MGTRAIVAVVSLLLVAGCSFAPIRISVQDVVLPAEASGGEICYIRVQESAPANFSHAAYTADATYKVEGVLPDTVEFRVYGRSEAPSGFETEQTFCVAQTGADIVLSEPIPLEPGETKPVTVGGGAYGDDLADLIAQPSYYLGAKVEGGSLIGSDSIVLENGTISVYF